jgi:phosphate transport system permease protein
VRDGALVRVVEPAGADGAAVPAEIAARAAERGVGGASVRRWLDGNYGDATPGWVLLCAAPAAALVGLVRARVGGANQRPTALAALAGLLGTLGATGATAWAMALGLTALGMDPRDSVFGPFNDRNSLVVGIIMGFAIIPIIFTISEDAMRSVPASLRSASLGAGATPWQTATRIVLPVAGSGIFSACMIGLGRAVGETMIVVMATGNTATMDPSVFSGFRTLSANIAVEVGEASVGDTLFRLLFLCGLILFAMTFVINTTAEVVRQRFRKRNAAL